jgi:biopolymer transport protein ExbB/TolQ
MANWIQFMGFGTRLIMLVLLMLSVWSVGIMIDRRKVFNKELGSVSSAAGKKFIHDKNWAALKAWAEGNPSFISGTALSALNAGSATPESVDRAVQSYFADERLRLEKGLNFLATLAANAAFIGLLGTVMGIIQSFGVLSSQQGSAMNSVLFGLAEALLTTAIGIFVAVPAAIAYNHFAQRLRNAILEASSLRDLYVSKAVE